MRLRSLIVATLVAAALGVAAAVVVDPPAADAVDTSRVIGRYVLKLKGDGFDRKSTSLRYNRENVRGAAVLTISRPVEATSAAHVDVTIELESRLAASSVLGSNTPSPAALKGTGLLVGDSLTVIGNGQPNFVNAISLRFRKKGKRVDGWWLAAFPATDLDAGFAGSVGLQFRGRLTTSNPIQPVPLPAVDVVTPARLSTR